MVKKKQTEEQKQAAFAAWQASEEYTKIFSFSNARNTIMPIEMGTRDISDKWDQFLKELFELMVFLKVPGRKAKSYEQQYVRTMFLEKCEKKSIDGTTYDITMGCGVEIWNCKSKIVEIYNYLDPSMMEMQLTHETYISWKKELIKMLKEWDKLYVKHIKSGYVEMNAIHMQAMKPLTNLLESNLNFHYLELIEKKKDVPSFRHDALEQKFEEHMTKICEIFYNFGTLKNSFDIKQMLHVLKTKDWPNIPPLSFYFQPLQDALNDTRNWLLKMNEDGILRCKYIIEDNTELMDKTILMIQKDLIAQWLGGDELKQDQFKFIYKVTKVIFDCALRDKLVNNDPHVVDTVIPQMVAFYSILNIKHIHDTKALEKIKEEEKAEREGRKVTFGSTKEEEKKGPLTEEQIYRRRIEQQLNQSTTSQFTSEMQKQRELDKQENEKYGRMWIWDGYINPAKKEQFLACAEKLRHVNSHVVEDIEDFILLQGFKGMKPQDIKKTIDSDLHNRRMKKKNRTKEDEEEEKIQDQRRNFLYQMRPKFCWNFFDDSEVKIPHLLRYNASPMECYEDGRVQSILKDISEIGHHLAKYEEVNWKRLRDSTLEIFRHMDKHEGDDDDKK